MFVTAGLFAAFLTKVRTRKAAAWSEQTRRPPHLSSASTAGRIVTQRRTASTSAATTHGAARRRRCRTGAGRTAVIDPGEHRVGALVEQRSDDDDLDDEHCDEPAGHTAVGAVDSRLEQGPQQDHGDDQFDPVHHAEHQSPRCPIPTGS